VDESLRDSQTDFGETRPDAQTRLRADYHQAGFEAAFREVFRIAARRPIPGSLRCLYVMRRRDTTVTRSE
jgi:hypothetical protein